MTAPDIAALNRKTTAVFLPSGVLEEHGPHLPTYTDGYASERLTVDLANRVVERKGWKAVIFPPLPIGVGGANEIGFKNVFPGSYGVRATTLRSVLMDWATQLGEQGFRYVFVIHGHGSPLHNRAIDEACQYFKEEFGGEMHNMANLLDLPKEFVALPRPKLSEQESKENGADIHAGYSETSRLLYIRGDLVRSIYASLVPVAGDSMNALVELAKKEGWQGYFGSPRLASSSDGALLYNRILQSSAFTLSRILDGFDSSKVPKFADEILADPAERVVMEGSVKRDIEVKERQEKWLKKHQITAL